MMKSHHDIAQLETLLQAVREYQELATKHGIPDIFQDNGGKILQVCLRLGLTPLTAREGNDAHDSEGREYEIKTVNVLKTKAFTTHHHMNPRIIAKYRQVDWIFATYKGIDLCKIFLLRSTEMEYWYRQWEDKWHADGGKDINNPKVPLAYVVEHGTVLYTSH